MTESTTASATIDISNIADTTGLRDTIKGAIGDKRLSLFIDNTEAGDKTAGVEVQGMTDPELAELLTSLNFRLVEKSTPVATKTESADIAKMPKPTINGNDWNMAECLDWLEAFVATATDKTKAYREAVSQLTDAITIADEYSKKLPIGQITSSFHAAFAGEICHREPHGVELWKHKHGIELTEANHV